MDLTHYRFDFSLESVQYIVQIQAQDADEALRVLEHAHPEVRSEPMIGISQSEWHEEINAVSNDHLRIEYLNTL